MKYVVRGIIRWHSGVETYKYAFESDGGIFTCYPDPDGHIQSACCFDSIEEADAFRQRCIRLDATFDHWTVMVYDPRQQVNDEFDMQSVDDIPF